MNAERVPNRRTGRTCRDHGHMVNEDNHKRIVVAVTGAAARPTPKRLLECLAAAGTEIHLVVSPNGQRLLQDELGVARADTEALVGPHTPGA